jgi:hypothetical protein
MIPYIRKALTVWSPWAELLAAGVKPVENRTRWPHKDVLGGHLLIHAAKVPADPRDLRVAWRRAPGIEPLGANPQTLLALVRLVGIAEWGGYARSPRERREALVWPPADHELHSWALLALARAAPGRKTWFSPRQQYGWLVDQVLTLPGVKVGGQQGLWVPSLEVLRQVRHQVAALRADGERCGRCRNPLSARMRCLWCSEEVCVDECGPALRRAPENACCERCKAKRG